MQNRARAHVFVSGLVQGVFFRQYIKIKAREGGVTGWVKNLSNGKVEAVFEGGREKIETMIKWSSRGPKNAQVEDIKINWEKYKGDFKNFKIIYIDFPLGD